jgi:hypothetical protein
MMALLNARGWRYVTIEKRKGCSPCIEGQEGTNPKRYIRPTPSSEEGELLLKISGHIEQLPEPCVQTLRKGLGPTIHMVR